MKKSHWLPALVLAFGLAAPFGAAQALQDADAAAPAALEEEDVITIYGDGRMDKGLKAFLDGDYATAEVEFEANFKCAERVRMLEEASVEQAVSDAIEGEYAAQAQSGITRNGGWGGGEGMYSTPQEVAGIHNRNPRDADGIKDRTCENQAWQLYMMGLSQIQQGKYDEAKRNFYRVINMSREPFLFDAHYRIALLEILDGNYDKAEERLKTLIVLQERCRRQDERCDYREEIDEIVAYLGPALERSRAETAEG